MKKIYNNLVELVERNINDSGLEEIYFEREDGLKYSLLEFPKRYLLGVDDSEAFVNECFLKILDRYIDEGNLHLIEKVKNKSLSKEKLIKSLYSSEERKKKNLKIKENEK